MLDSRADGQSDATAEKLRSPQHSAIVAPQLPGAAPRLRAHRLWRGAASGARPA